MLRLLPAFLLFLPPAPGGQQPAPPRQDDARPIEAAAKLTPLLDRFHAVMPGDPRELRRAAVRTTIAPKVGPVLVELVEACRHGAGPSPIPFEVYGLALGEPTILSSVLARAAAGEVDARAELAAAAAITAGDAAARSVAVDALCAHVHPGARGPQQGQIDALYAAELAAAFTPDELRRLAAAAGETPLAKRLQEQAEREETSIEAHLGRRLALTGTTLTGEAWSTADAAGRVLVVDFWATWCAPCVRALPELAALRRDHPSEQLAITAVSSDKELASLRKFLAAHPEYSWPQLVAPELLAQGKSSVWHPLATQLAIDTIPCVLVFDRQGVLRRAGGSEGLTTFVEELLRE